ncbi:HAD family hydrolase [Streptacidiphilus jiangxiensis]|uniref:Putative hydrolase of the HAD superfamily n=1 Tax=Streptacidiphilus jiangxiensis TaxID=235985 RepID=A0A1H7HP68_STRJI|nr:HAD family phosphatase [Streptacidiphilus jiangxiensis]SEK51994.1 putative hydrolase of the HAD superfamily [Streptacidiphilus jiangxiensis]
MTDVQPDTPPKAVLTDFGGVLTTDVFASFRAYSARLTGDPHTVERLLREDETVTRALVDHERGRLPQAGLETALADALRARGTNVSPVGLLAAISADIRPDLGMVAALRRLHAAGVPVALVSNALGDDLYRDVDLPSLCDVAVISSEVGERKPGRRIYAIACERLGVAPTDCLMIDDLQQNLDGAARLGIRGLHHVDGAATVHSLELLFPQAFD